MTEGNFVDYIKVYASSGNGGSGSMHLHREKFITKGGQMVEMAVVADILLFVVIKICGHYFT